MTHSSSDSSRSSLLYDKDNSVLDAGSRKPIEITCPACGERTVYGSGNPYRPFCSARCQGHDFGAWANEGYRVVSSPDPSVGGE